MLLLLEPIILLDPNLFGDLPAEAFEPLPIGGNTRTTRIYAPPIDASVLDSVLERALLLGDDDDDEVLLCEPTDSSLSSNVSNVRKPSQSPPITSSAPMHKKRRLSSSSNHHQPRFRGYQERLWDDQFEELLKFKKEHGHCLVPNSNRENQVLSRWVKRQRYQYKLKAAGKLPSTMTNARIQKLENIGFVWDSHAATWDNRLKELAEFREKFGHCNVTSNHPENPELATWIKCQRRQYKLFWADSKKKKAASSMTVERMNALNELGFSWKVRDDFPFYLPCPSLIP